MSRKRGNRRSKGRPSGTGVKRKNTKITGEKSEAAFLARAAGLGLGVAKPWGDSRRYDFILDNGECLHRVQVKCTESLRARAYETRATYSSGKGRAVYTRKDIDFLAAHVVPLDLWYIIPVEECESAPMLRFYPHRTGKQMRLECYREAWNQVLPKEDGDTIDIHAAADPRWQRSLLQTYRTLCAETPLTRIDGNLAPWPLPPLKILVLKKIDKRILPEPEED